MSIKKSQVPRLSVLIHTKNEEKNIVECIRSCKDLADEILVFDMMSTDETVTHAKNEGAQVTLVPDYGFVEPVRQLAIDSAKGPWILLLDADERLTVPLKKEIKKYLSNPFAPIVRFPRKNIFFEQWLRHGLQWPDYQVRLFQKGSLRWPPEIHSQPQYDASTYDFPAQEKFALLHFHTDSFQKRLRKIEEQALHESYYVKEKIGTAETLYERIELEFPNRYLQEEGYKDGTRGFVVAKMMEHYRFLEFVYAWEANGYPEILEGEDIKILWNQEKMIKKLIEENKQFYDSKLYRFYVFLKNIFWRLKQLSKP